MVTTLRYAFSGNHRTYAPGSNGETRPMDENESLNTGTRISRQSPEYETKTTGTELYAAVIQHLAPATITEIGESDGTRRIHMT